jgi:hypothetical protein
MKTFKQYIEILEALDQPSRRGFLKGLASFAAAAAVPAPVVKLLSTPAGVAGLSVADGLALMKGIQTHLDQWGAEDDDDYYESREDMADILGFEDIESDDGDDKSASDQMYDLLDLYDQNPEMAAAQLIKHLQNTEVSPADVTKSFVSRADNPGDWRYQAKNKKNKPKPYGYGYDSWEAENTPEQNKIVVYKTDFDGNIASINVSDNRKTDPITELNRIMLTDRHYNRHYNYYKYTVTNGGNPVQISTTSPKYIDPSKLSNKLTPAQVSDKIEKIIDDGGDAWNGRDADPSVAADNISPVNAARLAGLAGGTAASSTNQSPAPAATVKNMGPVQYAKDTPALPAPTKPEFDLTPDLKSKQKVPAAGKNPNLKESVELYSILKNAGLKK